MNSRHYFIAMVVSFLLTIGSLLALLFVSMVKAVGRYDLGAYVTQGCWVALIFFTIASIFFGIKSYQKI